MPWLEVPDWRAWEPYARDMPTNPKPKAKRSPKEKVEVVTGELAIVLDEDAAAVAAEEAEEVASADAAADAPSIDDVLAGNVEGEDDDVDAQALADTIEQHPSGRFAVENAAERVDEPAAARLPESVPADHVPPTVNETDDERARRIEKESMSRQERRRRGW